MNFLSCSTILTNGKQSEMWSVSVMTLVFQTLGSYVILVMQKLVLNKINSVSKRWSNMIGTWNDTIIVRVILTMGKCFITIMNPTTVGTTKLWDAPSASHRQGLKGTQIKRATLRVCVPFTEAHAPRGSQTRCNSHKTGVTDEERLWLVSNFTPPPP